MSSDSSSITNLKKQIDAIAEINVDTSQDGSDLLANIDLLTPKSNSSNKSSNDSDDHLLDFLDNSQLLSDTPKSNKFKTEFSPPDSSFALSTSSSPNSNNNEHETDITAFITAFNTKYDLAAVTLFDVLDLIDSMIEKQSKPEKKEKEEKEPQRPKVRIDEATLNQINSLKAENNTIKSKLDDANNSMRDAQALITTLEQQIQNLKSTNAVLQSSNASLQNDIDNLHKSLNSIHGIMESQLDDLSSLGTQRTKLIELTKKQDAMMQQCDQLFNAFEQAQLVQQSNQQTQVIENPVDSKLSKRHIEDEFYKLICSTIRIVDESGLPENVVNSVHSIRDDSKLPINERELSIVRNLIGAVSSVNEKSEQLEKENKRALESQQTLHKKCNEILAMFEEELNFLQNLSHSSDLQAIVFNQSRGSQSPLLTDESKSEIIKRCANLGRFVEETIGVISLEKFEESFEVPDGIEGTHIFELLNSTQITENLSELFAKFTFNNDNIEARQIFDMFCAQVYMNNLLKNHANELLLRISHCSREITTLRQELNEKASNQDQTDTMKKIIKRFRHRESKLRRYLSKYVEISDDMQINDAVVSIVDSLCGKSDESDHHLPLSKENEQLRAELAKYEKEFNEIREEFEKSSGNSAKCEELAQKNQELQEQLNDYQTKLKEATHGLEEKADEINNLKAQLDEKLSKINEFANQIESAEQSHQNALREANERIEFAYAENKKLVEQIDNFENAMARVKRNRQQLTHEIERLKKINIQLTESLDNQHNKLKSEYNATIRELTDANEKYTRENSDLQSQVQILTAKNQQLTSENATLSIAKKSCDLKLRSIDEKLSLEKRNIQSQVSAQVTAAKVENSKKLNELNNKIEIAINRLSLLGNIDRTSVSNLDDAISYIEEELNRSKKSQYLYVQLLENIKDAEKLLNVSSPDQLVDAINNLVEKQASTDRLLSDNEKKAKTEKQEIEKLRRDAKKSEGQVVMLKQWESWAKRIHRIIHEAEYVHLDSDQLRQSLEEALLASVSSRQIFMRVESLRTQKNVLEKFDKRLLYTRQNIKGSMRPVIAICLSIRRMQKFAGCLPISLSISAAAASEVGGDIQPVLKQHSSKKERVTPRKKRSTPSRRSQKERGSCKSPLRPLIPLFM